MSSWYSCVTKNRVPFGQVPLNIGSNPLIIITTTTLVIFILISISIKLTLHSITNGIIGYLSLYAELNSLDISIFVIEEFAQQFLLLKHVSLEYFPEEME